MINYIALTNVTKDKKPYTLHPEEVAKLLCKLKDDQKQQLLKPNNLLLPLSKNKNRV